MAKQAQKAATDNAELKLKFQRSKDSMNEELNKINAELTALDTAIRQGQDAMAKLMLDRQILLGNIALREKDISELE